jgi:hypothetical protein
MELLYQKDSFQKQNRILLLKQIMNGMLRVNNMSVDYFQDIKLETYTVQSMDMTDFTSTLKIKQLFS